jgi:hypothetical protein
MDISDGKKAPPLQQPQQKQTDTKLRTVPILRPKVYLDRFGHEIPSFDEYMININQQVMERKAEDSSE